MHTFEFGRGGIMKSGTLHVPMSVFNQKDLMIECLRAGSIPDDRDSGKTLEDRRVHLPIQ
jgi:hypothetical protein